MCISEKQQKVSFSDFLTVTIVFVTFSIQRLDRSLKETFRNVMQTNGTAVNSAIGFNTHMPRRKITPSAIVWPLDAQIKLKCNILSVHIQTEILNKRALTF